MFACSKAGDGSDSPQEEARQRVCPELKTWAECVARQEREAAAARASAAAAAASAAVVRDQTIRSAETKIAAAWAAYDALPKRTKKDLFAVVDTVTSSIEALPPGDATRIREQSASMARERMAPLIAPETKATGDGHATLVPSADAIKCKLWGSMWAKDSDTVDSLVTLGFQNVACGEKRWDLKELANVCYLRWTKDNEHTPDDPILVWKTLELFVKARAVGSRTDDRAVMEYLALVSRGADTMDPGGHFVIEDKGPGWVRIAGRDKQEGLRGYVHEDACRRKP
jgi:hypothetical protein